MPGMTYSAAVYRVIVTVTDNGDGTLSANAVMTKTSDNSGQDINPPQEIGDKTAVFVNTFNAESVSAGAVANKVYIDNSGKKPLTNGMFRFKIRAIGENAAEAPKPVATQPDKDGYYYVHNEGGRVQFEQFVFTAEQDVDI